MVQKTAIFEGKVFCKCAIRGDKRLGVDSCVCVYVDVITGTKSSDFDVGGVSKNDLDLLIKENGGEYRQNKTADILIAGVRSK